MPHAALRVWVHRFAVLTSAMTLGLIFVGGLVTSTGSGLAVPDWPLSFGQVFPPMVGGVFYEHGHRLVAAFVGMLTVTLVVLLSRWEPRAWVRWFAGGALLAVLLQGLLGGLTVLWRLPTVVSVTHACLAQTFFCLTVVLAVCTAPGWYTGTMFPADSAQPSLRWLATGATGAVFLQLFLGALMRHKGAGLAIGRFSVGLWTPLATHGVASRSYPLSPPPGGGVGHAVHWLDSGEDSLVLQNRATFVASSIAVGRVTGIAADIRSADHLDTARHRTNDGSRRRRCGSVGDESRPHAACLSLHAGAAACG